MLVMVRLSCAVFVCCSMVCLFLSLRIGCFVIIISSILFDDWYCPLDEMLCVVR